MWRVRDRLRFAAPVAIEREELVAIAGEPSGLARLHFIDALSGARRYERTLEAAIATDCAPMLMGKSIVVVTRDRRGIGLLALDRVTGVEKWCATPGAWPIGTCAMAVEAPQGALVVLNMPTGEVLALSADSGDTVWRHVFDAPFHGDSPRRLEPVLRGGALFVPQDKVRVLRPQDGAIVGTVPSDLVPDLLRVDERCDVYLAEESGHVAAFGATARLELVK
ncbi:MAG: PQQ-binding-like beta-propeller repeat protein [Polyangiales bacterium]